MADTPIPKQEGLSEEDLKKMEVITQKFIDNFPQELVLVAKLGTEAQKKNLSANLHQIMIDHERRMQKLDPNNEYSTYYELEKYATDLAKFIVKAVTTQMVTVTTNDSTDVTLNGTQTNTTSGATTPISITGSGTGTGTSTSEQVEIS